VLPYRLSATLFTLFAVLALTLAAVGLYGMLGYFIAERRPELGIRKSLGADGADVVRLVVGQGMRPVLVGLGVGLGAAYAGVHLLQALLFGVASRDLATFVLVAGFLSAVALVASYIPARRAATVDPMIALRAE
jgi:putative ABC transport system permease protein